MNSFKSKKTNAIVLLLIVCLLPLGVQDSYGDKDKEHRSLGKKTGFDIFTNGKACPGSDNF